MAVLEPKLAILDETDSGLDIDALRTVANGVNKLKKPENATIVITHYHVCWSYIVPDVVHVDCMTAISFHRQRAGSRTGREGI